MNLIDLLNLSSLSEFVLNCGLQSILITGSALVILRLWRIKSVPLKSLVLVSLLVSLLCLPIVNYFIGNSTLQWSQISISHIFAAQSTGANRAFDLQTASVATSVTSGFSLDQIDNPIVAIVNCLALVWVCGLVVSLVRLLVSCFKMHHLKCQLIPLDGGRVCKIWKELAGDNPRDKRIQLLSIPVHCSPFSFGFWSPKIVVPSTLISQWTDAEIRSALVHEKTHLKQHDTFLGLMQRLFKALYWWNPLARWINSQLSLARELLCDFAAVEHLGNRKAYATTLVNLSEHVNLMQRLPSSSYAMARSLSSLEVRIKSLNKKNKIMNTPITKRQKFVTCLTIAAVGITTVGIKTSFAHDVGEKQILEIRSIMKNHPEIRREILEGDAKTAEMEREIRALRRELEELRKIRNVLASFPELRRELSQRHEAEQRERRRTDDRRFDDDDRSDRRLADDQRRERELRRYRDDDAREDRRELERRDIEIEERVKRRQVEERRRKAQYEDERAERREAEEKRRALEDRQAEDDRIE